jgi:hypothetical protein
MISDSAQLDFRNLNMHYGEAAGFCTVTTHSIFLSHTQGRWARSETATLIYRNMQMHIGMVTEEAARNEQ